MQAKFYRFRSAVTNLFLAPILVPKALFSSLSRRGLGTRTLVLERQNGALELNQSKVFLFLS